MPTSPQSPLRESARHTVELAEHVRLALVTPEQAIAKAGELAAHALADDDAASVELPKLEGTIVQHGRIEAWRQAAREAIADPDNAHAILSRALAADSSAIKAPQLTPPATSRGRVVPLGVAIAEREADAEADDGDELGLDKF